MHAFLDVPPWISLEMCGLRATLNGMQNIC